MNTDIRGSIALRLEAMASRLKELNNAKLTEAIASVDSAMYNDTREPLTTAMTNTTFTLAELVIELRRANLQIEEMVAIGMLNASYHL